MNYLPGDCRIGRNAPCFDGQHAMTVGPRVPNVRLPGRLLAKVDPRYVASPGPNRRMRREIGATYRKLYGKAAFAEMRARAKKEGSKGIAALMQSIIEG